MKENYLLVTYVDMCCRKMGNIKLSGTKILSQFIPQISCILFPYVAIINHLSPFVYFWLYTDIFAFLKLLNTYSKFFSKQDSFIRHNQYHHDDVIKWKHFPRYWPFGRGIHRSPVNSPHKGQWRGALMFSLVCTRVNNWVNNRELLI